MLVSRQVVATAKYSAATALASRTSMRRGLPSRVTLEGGVCNLISRNNTFDISSKLGALEDVILSSRPRMA